MTQILNRWCTAVVVFGALASAACTARTSPPAAKPVVSVKATMTALTERASGVLWNAETDEQVPKTDDDWTRIEHHAVQVVLSAALIDRGVAGPVDPAWLMRREWRKYMDDMTGAARAAEAAAKAKNIEALSAANGSLLDSCEGCHKTFLSAR